MAAVDFLLAQSDEEIASTFDVMSQLRPQLQRDQYVSTIRELRASDGLQLIALRDDGQVCAVATYRVMNMLYCGRLLYVDDLVTDERARSRGHGARLLSRLKEAGRALGCNQIQLISHVTREGAHRFYFREGLGIECFHFRANLAETR